MAQAQAAEALSFAGDRAVQFHGGMGFTYDCDAMLYIRRAQWAQHQYGDQHQRKMLAPLLPLKSVLRLGYPRLNEWKARNPALLVKSGFIGLSGSQIVISELHEGFYP